MLDFRRLLSNDEFQLTTEYYKDGDTGPSVRIVRRYVKVTDPAALAAAGETWLINMSCCALLGCTSVWGCLVSCNCPLVVVRSVRSCVCRLLCS